MVCMIGFFNEMEILEVEINVKTKVDMMLETLLDSFKQFKLDYSMNMVNLLKLMRELHRVEGILKDQKSVHMVVNSLNSFTKKKKNKNGNTQKKKKKKFKGKENKSKGKDKCLFCGKKGWFIIF